MAVVVMNTMNCPASSSQPVEQSGACAMNATPAPSKLLPWIQVRQVARAAASRPVSSKLHARLRFKAKLNLPELDVSSAPGTPVFLPSTPRTASETPPWYNDREVCYAKISPADFDKLKSTLYQEFNALEYVGMDQSTSSATIPANAIKNRYENIHPYNDTRVVLASTDANTMGYINASWCTAPRNGNIDVAGKDYIAAQGPLDSTCMDFWSMLWQTRATAVVMLTKVDDGSTAATQATVRRQSSAYWEQSVTDEVRKVMGLEVNVTEATTLSTHVERLFSISDGTDAKPRQIMQYHFLQWPDHGVPHLEDFLAFRRRIRETHKGMLVVHCSAGVGRTGTFCAIDSLLMRLDEQRSVNIPATVATLRQKRMRMCQTLEQYTFIYDVMKEAVKAISTKATVTPKHNDNDKAAELTRNNSNNAISFAIS